MAAAVLPVAFFLNVPTRFSSVFGGSLAGEEAEEVEGWRVCWWSVALVMVVVTVAVAWWWW